MVAKTVHGEFLKLNEIIGVARLVLKAANGLCLEAAPSGGRRLSLR